MDKIIQDIIYANKNFNESVTRIINAYNGNGFYGFIDDFTLLAVEPEDVVMQEAEMLFDSYSQKDKLRKDAILPRLCNYLKEIAEVMQPKPLKDPKYIKIIL